MSSYRVQLLSKTRLLWAGAGAILAAGSIVSVIDATKHSAASSEGPAGLVAAQQALKGSPAPLAALHRQAGELLGGQKALSVRLRGLRGYPVVINAWASWCGPCQAEFGLFASASARYGRRVAFIGVDTEDSAAPARAFLAAHPVSYPSYESPSLSALDSLAVIGGLPTTIFVDRGGRVVYVHIGQYASQPTLDRDITTYAKVGASAGSA